MKTITLTFLLAIIFCACNKTEEKNPIDGNMLRMELLKNGKEAQKQLFAKLSPQEKAAVWQDKIKQVIAQDWLNKVQKHHLQNALEIITPELFLDSTKEADYFINHFEPKWRDEGIRIFTFGPFRQIVNSLDNFQTEQHLSKRIIPIEDGPANTFTCECNEGSDWCWFQNCDGTCHLGNDIGCGTFFRYECNGACVN